MEAVTVVYGDSAVTPKSGPAVASRSAYCSGNAVKLAAEELKAKLLIKATEMLRVELGQLTYGRGRVSVLERPQKSVSIAELASACHGSGVNLVAESWFHIDHPDNAHSFATAVADVEIDGDTGVVELLKLVVAHDAGRALNPQVVRGQLIGGAVMGAGYALSEDAATAGGRLLTSTLADYLIMTSLDVGEYIHSIIVEEPLPGGPFGVRGVGEATTGTVPPAVVNAIYHAVGVMVTDLPATPEVVLRAIRRKQAE
jgi:CO/xanthine dehydrogenase Mo-binding subunit